MTEQDRKLAKEILDKFNAMQDYGEAYHESKMKEITDEDIELYARRHSLSEATERGIIEGAKAFRDGLIKHKEK